MDHVITRANVYWYAAHCQDAADCVVVDRFLQPLMYDTTTQTTITTLVHVRRETKRNVREET